MTVGIGAICEADTDDAKVVVSADRMVTSGRAARREHEHTNSKMVPIIGNGGNAPVVAVGVGAGSVSLSDEIFFKVEQKIQTEMPETGRDVAEYAVISLQEVVRETINRQVLSPHGLDVGTFNQVQGQMNHQVVQGIYQEMLQKKEGVHGQVNILLAAVDRNGPHLYNIRNNDMARNDAIGYLTVGSGAEPANSSFIRSRYDDSCEIHDALLSVAEAKAHAEEAQGVGQAMDVAVLDSDGRRELDDDEIDELREIYEEVVDKEAQARDSVMQENNYTFNP